MSQLHYCRNGTSVTDQVILYQKTRENDDFIPIHEHYDDYKDIWFRQLCDYLDRESFDSEFDYKLVRAVDTFNEKEARSLAKKFNWPLLGMFNRWFYRILSNWKSNVKTSSFRVKKRPPVLCPVCGRWVARIDADHLMHYKTTKDLQKHVVHQDEIFMVYLSPVGKAVSYGKYDRKKMSALNQGEIGEYAGAKKRKPWPWFLSSGKPGVLCPLTKRIVPEITDEYIQTLSDRVSRYSEPYAWEDFIEEFPNTLIQSEIYSLDIGTDDEMCLGDQVSKDCRQTSEKIDHDLDQIRNNNVAAKYESVFFFIDQNVDDQTDRDILKLFAIGYSMDDISYSLEIGKNELKKRMRTIRTLSKDLEKCLIETI